MDSVEILLNIVSLVLGLILLETVPKFIFIILKQILIRSVFPVFLKHSHPSLLIILIIIN